jgi:phenylpropionate dioxygenase-like ring-hydroxylating dioxygenase large terminal subunit
MLNAPINRATNERWTDRYQLGHAYTSFEDMISPSFFELEREAVFRPSWLYVGRAERVAMPGAYFTKEIEIFKASILVTCDQDRKIHVFHNVCPHRGNKLVWDTYSDREVSGRCNRFFCKFHGIGYNPDGSLGLLTDKAAWLDDQGSKLHLQSVPFEIWNGFIFVNLNPGGPPQTLREFLGDYFWTGFDGYPFQTLTEWYSIRAVAKANWKLLMDGFAEVYHAPTTHALAFPLEPLPTGGPPSFPVDFWKIEGHHRQYQTSRLPDKFFNFEYERATNALSIGPRHEFSKELSNLPPAANPIRHTGWGTSSSIFWPNLYIQFYYPGWYLTYQMCPLAYDQMRFELDIYMPGSKNFSELLSHQASVTMFLETALQDFSLLEATQQGLETRAFNAFPLTDEEICVRDFHQKIYAAVERQKHKKTEVRR